MSGLVNGLEWPLKLLQREGGYYECPKDADGKRLGPLVGYAGRDPQGLQYVGDVYANFAVTESDPSLLGNYAEGLARGLRDVGERDFAGFIGVPEGGRTLAYELARFLNKSYIYPEKQVLEQATATSRAKEGFTFKRHTPLPHRSYVLVEDVCNNFSSTQQLIDLVDAAGAGVRRIVCILNRSSKFQGIYPLKNGHLPITALVSRPMPEWQQDDPAVADDIAKGNVVWKPKDEWKRLSEYMR